ncbi:hypothetical protein EIP91_007399 [Steccherinum ochraceum]|uniref:Ribosomal RNA-processing protein 17 n=1 Tax=Steccherinum ochraceum TaxID=92696 RepID=A0A4R0RWK2_9APHY|nr:hypothetical protein EIP91_007399 [Steccherinum ochraceum]
MSSNLAVLTHSQKIVASKKKARRDQVKEVVFDDGARHEFLTGFHKRKVQKKEAAKKKAEEREKQERLDAMQDERSTGQMLAERATENAKQVEKAYREAIAGEASDDDEETVFSPTSKGKDEPMVADEEYEDEEQLATVTVVEDFDPDTIIHGPSKPQAHPIEPSEVDVQQPSVSREKRPIKSHPSRQDSVTAKKSRVRTIRRAKDIKYQTKADRQTERTKQLKRKKEKAELAGGKASRKKVHGRGKRS